MTVTREDPPYALDEESMLNAWLEYHRATLAIKCEGLTDEQLRLRSVPPSTLSLLGLVRHMADVERNWFRRVFEGEDAPPLHYTPEDRDGEFDGVDDADVGAAFAAWNEECAHARHVVASASALDTVGKGRRRGEEVTLRWIMVHMIEEYARHNGHADLLRERIDGATGD
jgi:uncharacterized damage-inducible protein DinB